VQNGPPAQCVTRLMDVLQRRTLDELCSDLRARTDVTVSHVRSTRSTRETTGSRRQGKENPGQGDPPRELGTSVPLALGRCASAAATNACGGPNGYEPCRAYRRTPRGRER
jgi:hypothetical protein